MLDQKLSLDNARLDLALLSRGLQAFRRDQPRLDLIHFELLLAVASQPSGGIDRHARKARLPGITVSLALKELGRAEAHLVSFVPGSGGRPEDVKLTAEGAELVQTIISSMRDDDGAASRDA